VRNKSDKLTVSQAAARFETLFGPKREDLSSFFAFTQIKSTESATEIAWNGKNK